MDLKVWLAQQKEKKAKADEYLAYINELLDSDLETILVKIKQRNGLVKGPYFLNEDCTSENKKIKRGKYGQEIHHDKEGTADDPRVCALSDPATAAYYPYEWQQPENLTIVDKLEHLLVHVKGNIRRMYALDQLISDCVDQWMIPTLNKLYEGEYVSDTAQKAFSIIKDYKTAYFAILEYYDKARADFINKK